MRCLWATESRRRVDENEEIVERRRRGKKGLRVYIYIMYAPKLIGNACVYDYYRLSTAAVDDVVVHLEKPPRLPP